MRLIDADALYAKLQEHEELARKRVWDTASTLPFPNNINPAYTRYLAQLDERTALKHMVADAPTIAQPEIIRCRDCKHKFIENGVWTCPFCLPGGELFFCGYGIRPEDRHEAR